MGWPFVSVSMTQNGQMAYSLFVARLIQIAVWAAILVVAVLAYWVYLQLAPMD